MYELIHAVYITVIKVGLALAVVAEVESHISSCEILCSVCRHIEVSYDVDDGSKFDHDIVQRRALQWKQVVVDQNRHCRALTQHGLHKSRHQSRRWLSLLQSRMMLGRGNQPRAARYQPKLQSHIQN